MAEVKRYQTPVFRVSFPELAEAKAFNNGEPKFGLSAVWTPAKFTDKEKELWKAIGAALDAESKERFKVAFKDLPANIKRGIRDGAEKANMEGYGAGTKFASLTTKMRPGVVDKDKAPIPVEALKEAIYPGCYCRATVTTYSYDRNGGKGVALGLMNVQKVADGGRLDSRTDAAEDFEDDVDSAFLEQDEGSVEDDPLA